MTRVGVLKFFAEADGDQLSRLFLNVLLNAHQAAGALILLPLMLGITMLVAGVSSVVALILDLIAPGAARHGLGDGALVALSHTRLE